MKSDANKTKHLSIRVDTDLLNKFYYVSKYYGRSGRMQIIYLLRTLVEDFECEYGDIAKEDMEDFGIGD